MSIDECDNDEWRRKRKIARLNHLKQSPQTVLASTLEKSPKIRHVFIVMQWDSDGSIDVDHSTMKPSDVLLFAKIAEIHGVDMLFGRADNGAIVDVDFEPEGS